MIYYFAIFAILLTSSANPLAEVHRGRIRSSSVIGHTSEICEPSYGDRHHYREHDDDFGNHRHRNRDKHYQDSYEDSDEMSDDSFRETELEKALSIAEKAGLSHSRIRDNAIDAAGDDAYKRLHRIAKKMRKRGKDLRESVGPTITDHDSNINVNSFGDRKRKITKKSFLNTITERKTNAGDIGDDEESTEPLSRMFDRVRSKHDPPPYFGYRIDKLSNRDSKVEDSTEPLSRMFDRVRSKHDPPPYFGYRIDKLSNRDSKVEDSTEPLSRMFERVRSKHDPPPYFGYRIDKLSNKDSNVKDSTEPLSRMFERVRSKHDPPPYFGYRIDKLSNGDSNVDAVNEENKIDQEVLSRGNNQTDTFEDVKNFINSEPIEIVTATSTSPVTDAISSSPDNANNRLKKSSKNRKPGEKSYGKKKRRRTRHGKKRQKSELSEQRQRNKLSENKVETTTSIVESAQESIQSPVMDNSLVDKIEAENKLDQTYAILKLLNRDPQNQSTSHKARKLEKLVQRLADNEKNTISQDPKRETNQDTTKAKRLGDKTVVENGDGAKKKMIIDAESSDKIGTSSDDDPTNHETTDSSKSPDKTEQDLDAERNEPKTGKNVGKIAVDGFTINEESPENESEPNNADTDDNAASDRDKAAKILSILRDSKLNGITEESSKKKDNDSVDKSRDSEDVETIENGAGREDDESTELLKNSERKESLDKGVSKLNSVDGDRKDGSNENVNNKNLPDRAGNIGGSENRPINIDRKLQDNVNEEKILTPPDEGGETNYRRRNYGRRGNKNSNVNSNSNVNEMRPELRRLSPYRQRISDKSSESTESRYVKKLRRPNKNGNTNVNSNVNTIDAGASYEAPSNRRSLDRSIINDINSNYNKNVNTNSNVNQNSLDSHRHRNRDKKLKQLAKKERESNDDIGLDPRGRLLHKRHDDMVYSVE